VLVKTFRAATMPEALDCVRDSLGPEAVLLKTRMVATGRERSVEITAAVDRIPATPQSAASDIDRQAWHDVSSELESARSRIERLERGDSLTHWLQEADFLPAVARDLLQAAEGSESPQTAVETAIVAGIQVGQGLLPLPDQGRRIALIGPPGAGKTTTLVKLAAQASSVSRGDTVLVNLDSYRPGAEEYLAQVGDTLRIPVLSEGTREVQKGLPEADGLILIDTDARLYASDPGAIAIRATLKRLQPDVTALVLPATWRAADLTDAVKRYQTCEPTHLVFSGIDLTVRYGGMFSAALTSGLPVACVITTGRFDSGTRLFRPEAFLQQMQSLHAPTAPEKETTRVQ
jgi:flagellar biosynthesis GTPase FlhF